MYSRSSALTFFLDTNHFQTATEINQKKTLLMRLHHFLSAETVERTTFQQFYCQ